MKFNLDPNAAREGSGSAGGSINETGHYIGVIEWAREKTFDSGAEAIEIRFKADSGESTNLSLFTSPANDGGIGFGVKQINALMTCCSVRELSSTQGEVEAYNPDTKQVEKVQAQVFPQLAGKRVGMLLQKEFYEKNGEQKYAMKLYAPFSADKQQTAKEILDQKGETGAVEKMADNLKDKYRNGAIPSTGHDDTMNYYQQLASQDDSSEIPF